MSGKRGKSLDNTISNQYKELKNNMDVLLKEYKDIKTKLEEAIKSTQFLSDKYDDNETNMKEIKEQLLEIKNQNKAILERNAFLEKQIKQEQKERTEMEERFYSIVTPIEIERRENNLELHGLPEQNDEVCSTVVKEVLSKVTANPIEIENCYRFGKKENTNGKPRRILIKFKKKSTVIWF